MELDALIDLVARSLAAGGSRVEDGEVYREPELEVVAYWHRRVRLSRLPIVGAASSVVALARQPADLALPASAAGLVGRLSTAAHTRFPPWPRGAGLSLGLTSVILTERLIGPDDEAGLDRALGALGPGRSRVVSLGVLVLNLAQGAMAQSIAVSLPDLFPEPTALPEALSNRFGRFVPGLPAD